MFGRVTIALDAAAAWVRSLFMLWCNGPVRGCSLGLQADFDTSGRIRGDDALSSS